MKTTKSIAIFLGLCALSTLHVQAQSAADFPVPETIAFGKCFQYQKELKASPVLSSAISAETDAKLCSCMEAHAKANPAISDLYQLESWSSGLAPELQNGSSTKELYEARLRLAFYSCVAPDVDRALETAIRAVPTQ